MGSWRKVVLEWPLSDEIIDVLLIHCEGSALNNKTGSTVALLSIKRARRLEDSPLAEQERQRSSCPDNSGLQQGIRWRL